MGKGRRLSMGSNAHQEVFEPEHESDLLMEMRQQDNRIERHLLEKLDNGIKWYIVVKAQFKKMVKNEDGVLVERTEISHLSTPTFRAINQMDIENDLPSAYKDLFNVFDLKIVPIGNRIDTFDSKRLSALADQLWSDICLNFINFICGLDLL